jgi:hypothetical protein
MGVVVLVCNSEQPDLVANIERLYPEHYKMGVCQWAISTPDLTETVVEKLGAGDGDMGSVVVFSINGYYGYHDLALWEFLSRNS